MSVLADVYKSLASNDYNQMIKNFVTESSAVLIFIYNYDN